MWANCCHSERGLCWRCLLQVRPWPIILTLSSSMSSKLGYTVRQRKQLQVLVLSVNCKTKTPASPSSLSTLNSFFHIGPSSTVFKAFNSARWQYSLSNNQSCSTLWSYLSVIMILSESCKEVGILQHCRSGSELIRAPRIYSRPSELKRSLMSLLATVHKSAERKHWGRSNWECWACKSEQR